MGEFGWLDEIDLSPRSATRQMGTRRLGDRPWLVFDDRRGHELELKQRLLAERPTEVLATDQQSWQAGADTLALVTAELAANEPEAVATATHIDTATRPDGRWQPLGLRRNRMPVQRSRRRCY